MQVRVSRSIASLGVAVGLACLVALSPANGTRAGAQGAPPPPPVPNATITPAIGTTPVPSTDTSAPATPSAEPSAAPPTTAPARRGRGRRHRGDAAAGASPSPAATSGAPEPTATPTSPAFATLDGSWEVQLQYIDRTEYSYFTIKQAAGALSGTWRVGGKTFPIAGTYDGRLLRFTSQGGPGLGPVTVSGYVEGASDMIGLVDFGGGALAPIPVVPLAVPGASPPAHGKTAVPVAIATGTGTPPPLSATPPPSSGTPFTAEHRAGPGGLFPKKK